MDEEGGAGGWGGASKKHTILSGTNRQNKVWFFNVATCFVPCGCVYVEGVCLVRDACQSDWMDASPGHESSR